jgi:hypothetical protein
MVHAFIVRAAFPHCCAFFALPGVGASKRVVAPPPVFGAMRVSREKARKPPACFMVHAFIVRAALPHCCAFFALPGVGAYKRAVAPSPVFGAMRVSREKRASRPPVSCFMPVP